MRKWSRTIGLLFTAALSVYSDQAFRANAATPVESSATPNGPDNSGVKVVDESADPFANNADAAVPATQPTTKPTEGTSVTNNDVNVSDAGTVEIHVNDANLVEVLRMLSLQSQRNIVASNQVTGHVTANLYGVTVREALDAILHANGYAYREKGNFIYVYTSKEIADIEKAERQMTTQVFRLFYTPAANAIVMIKPVLSADGQVATNTAAASGLTTGVTDTGGNMHATEDMLVITDYPDNLEKVRKVLLEIDRRPQQILIEATILAATLNEDNALGVDFNIIGGVDFSTITSALGQITGANIADAKAPVGDKNLSSVGTGNTFSSQVPNGFKVGVVTNNVSVFLTALEGVTDTVVLANPKVLALNKQKGEVHVGNQDGYVTTTVTENAQTQTVQLFETGTKLLFRPYIGDDGYIRMEIHPEDSTGGVSVQGGQSLPHKTTTEVTTNVMVKDNHTIVIGGLFRESSISDRNQVPGLGNIPLAGALFRRQQDKTVRQEIIILITPHIVKDDSSYAAQSEEELKELEKLRLGVRKGMMPWGRERLAEACYETAVAEMAKEHPDRCKALWHLDCATNLAPTFHEAIAMKEQLTGKQVTVIEHSTIRRFVTDQIMAEKANPPAYTTPPRVVPITPTTQPMSAAPAHPATQPAVNVAMAPATQPSTQPSTFVDAEDAPEAAEAPATQPATIVESATPATQPSVIVGVPATTQPSAVDVTPEMIEEMDEK